jgi:Zn-dependent M28 family amino/carboxypeptidase
VHTTPSASYGWPVVRNGWELERFELAKAPAGTALQGWVTEDLARSLVKQGGQDLDALRAAAQRRDFRPVPLDLRLKGTLHSAVRTLDQFNVAGVVPGTDPALKDELVVYSAHWDHLGKGAAAADTHPGQPGDTTYNGAANLNLDSLNFVAPTRDIGLPFANRSTLGDLGLAVAKASGLSVAPPRVDAGGGYFRSDHYSFVQAGVPALSVGGGRDYLGADPAALKARASAYGKRYHQVTDEYDPAWDLRGMVQQAQFTFDLGQAVANAPTRPAFKRAR